MNELKVSNVTELSGGSQYQKLIEVAITSNADIDKLERLMDLQERWEAKEAKKSYVQAMADFQAKCPTIICRKQGHNYKYAPMGDIIKQVGQLIADNGLSYRFEQESKDDLISITCVASHINGHSERLNLEGLSDNSGKKNAVQSIGSTITYLKRYSFLGVFGIATADEDIDGRVPTPAGKSGNWKPGMDSRLLPKKLREVFNHILEAYEAEDLQDVCERLDQFSLHEEQGVVWKCFASDERTKISKFKKEEYIQASEIIKVEYLDDKEIDDLCKKFFN